MAGGSKVRHGNGKWAPDPESAERDAEACRLRVRALSFAEIAEKLGFVDPSHAHRAVQRALKATQQEAADDLRAVELARLDGLYQTALAIVERDHLTVSNGRVVAHRVAGTGTWDPELRTWVGAEWVDLADDGPALAAIDRLLRIQERRAKLLGLDAPTRMQVVTVDAVDEEIARLTAELAAQGGPAAAAGASGEAAAPAGAAPAQG